MSAAPMRTGVAALLVALCAFAMLGLVLLYAFAPDLRSDDSSGADALSRSAVGFEGLKDLLGLSGIPVAIARTAPGNAAVHPSLVVLTPDASASARDFNDFRYAGPVLVILPKWVVAPMPNKPQWVVKAGGVATAALARAFSSGIRRIQFKRAPGSALQVRTVKSTFAPPSLPAAVYGHIEDIQTMSGGTTLLMADHYGPLLERITADKSRSGPIYLLSEPDLMNNHGLADQTTAKAAIAIIKSLRAGNGPVLMDVTLNGFGKNPSLLRALFEPPFVGGTICALVTALLMALHTAIRFGTPTAPARVFARGKKALADNSAELIRIMGREGAMAARYVRSARALALERLGAQRAALPQQDALIAAVERNSGAAISYAELQAEAAGARNGDDLLRIAKKSFLWRRRISGGN